MLFEPKIFKASTFFSLTSVFLAILAVLAASIALCWEYIAMKQLTDRFGNPDVFDLARYGSGLWLYGYWAIPDDTWDPEDQLLFSLRKSVETQNTPTPRLFDRIFRR